MQEFSDSDDNPYEVPVPPPLTVMASVNPTDFVSASTTNNDTVQHQSSSPHQEQQEGAEGGNDQTLPKTVEGEIDITVITDPSATLGDIHNQLYLMFHSLLEEIHNVYTSQDLVRVYITHEELVNTNIIVGPDYLGNINANIIMNQIADVVHSNNFIPTNGGLINITAIHNIKGLRHKIISRE